MKKYILFGAISIIVIGIIIVLISQGINHPKCFFSGGFWRGLQDSCVDDCSSQIGAGTGCRLSVTPSCDCGPFRCWDLDKEKCISNKKYEEEFTVEQKYAEWYAKEDKNVNFSHPYVKWITDKKGNGTFDIYIRTNNISEEEVNNTLNDFGMIKSFSCYEEECEFSLIIDNLDVVKNLFEIGFIKDFHINYIISDYKVDVPLEEMKKCSRDEDCVQIPTQCCGGYGESINKKYLNLWNTQLYCYNAACPAGATLEYVDIRCVDNQCERIPNICLNRWLYFVEHDGIVLIKFKEGISQKEIEELLNPINEIEPKLDHVIKFSFDMYTFILLKEKVGYPWDYKYGNFDRYIVETDEFINYLNNNPNINAFVNDYEEISLIVNNKELNEKDISNLVNSYNDAIKFENVSIQKNLYGFYYLTYNSYGFNEYICDNLEINKYIESINYTNVWLYEMNEIEVYDCTSKTPFFPIIEKEKC